MATESENRHIFISASEKDANIADSVVKSLEASKHVCWIAHRDIEAGMSWMGAIVQAIVDCKLMIVIVSEHSINSQHVLREVTIADQESIRFLPFRIDSSALSPDLRYFFSTAQDMDAVDVPLLDAIEALKSMLPISA